MVSTVDEDVVGNMGEVSGVEADEMGDFVNLDPGAEISASMSSDDVMEVSSDTLTALGGPSLVEWSWSSLLGLLDIDVSLLAKPRETLESLIVSPIVTDLAGQLGPPTESLSHEATLKSTASLLAAPRVASTNPPYPNPPDFARPVALSFVKS